MTGLELIHRFDSNFEVYFTSGSEGDARCLVSSGDIEKELSMKLGKLIRLETLKQVHSNFVHFVGGLEDRIHDTEPIEGDGLVSHSKEVGIGVLVADCAPVALVSNEGVFGAVHVGWKGLYESILPEALSTMRSCGATSIEAYVGPSIKSECYEFLGPELSELAQRLGPKVVGHTSWGTESLDMAESIKAQLYENGVASVLVSPVCTACSDGYFSYRARRDTQRHLLVVVPGGDFK